MAAPQERRGLSHSVRGRGWVGDEGFWVLHPWALALRAQCRDTPRVSW